jgi:hypothetical protein
MQYKPAAGIFVGGVTMSIGGPILATASGFFALGVVKVIGLSRSKELQPVRTGT